MIKLRDLLKEILVFTFLVGSIALLWDSNSLLFVVISALSVIALFLWHDRVDLSFFVIIAIFGTIAEIIFVKFGVWIYANPTLLGIPIWFPQSFGTAGLVGQRLIRTIVGLSADDL